MEIKKIKILAIDDNPDNLISLKALIREAFPEAPVFTSISGKRGLELSIQEDPDVILLDIVMPEMDGFEVCRKLKADQRLSDIPVVFVTAQGDKESRIKALECGGEAFLAKPVDESELTAQIRAMVKIKTANTDKRNENERLKRLVEERTSELEAELSERKRAEKALKQSEERFQLLFNQAPLGYQSLDFDGCFIEVNQQWLDTLGFTREEVIGKWFGDFLSPEYQEGFRKRFPLFKAQGHIHSEFEMVHKNGSRLFIAFEGKIGYNLDGGFKQTHCILQDITQKKLAEEALAESEEKYSILFKNSPDSYLIISDGIFVDCNKATEVMMRGDRSQIIGQTPDAISPEIQPDGKISSESAAENIAWAFANGKNTFEWMHRRFDGSDLYVEVSIAPMMLKGKLTLFTTWRDISARKLAEKALQESEAQFREFFEKAADAIFIANIETGIIVDANAAASRLMNRTHDQLVGIHQSQLHPPVKENYAKDTFTKHTELVKQKVNSHAIENTVVRADGTEVPVEILASEVDYHGKSYMMGTFRDITERKKAEKAIQASEEKYRYMFQNNPQPMWIYDHDTLKILEINEISTIIYGYSREEFLSMTIKDIRPPEDIPLLLEDVEASRLNKNSLGEWRHLKKSGEIMDVEISASSILFNGRKARHVLIKDITERKRAEEAIRKSESMLRTLIESAPFEVWARDKDGVGILENENQVRHFGSILGKTPDHEGISPQVSQLWNVNNRRAMNGEIVNDECVYLVDGVERNFHQILAPIIVDGSIEGITGFNIDITERKVAEELLRESEYFFRESQRAAFVGSYKFDLIADHWTSSEVLDQIFGIDKNYTKSLQCWIDIVHPDDREMMAQYFSEEVVGKRQPFNKEYRIISQKDNEIRWVLGLGKLKLDAEDHVVEMIGTIQDITERVLSQQALNERTQLFQELFNASPDAIVLIDPHHPKQAWPIVDCNKAACQMNGYSREEMIGKSIDLLNTQDGTPEERQIYLMNLRQKGIIHGEYIHRNKDGHIFPVETSTSLVSIGGREMILGIDRDITERKQAEDALKASEDRYRRFISQISEGVYRFECDKPMDLNLPLEEQIDFIYDHMFIAECNHAFQEMYGIRDEKEVIGKSHLDFHGGRNNPLNRSSLRKFVNNGYHIEDVMTEEISPGSGQLVYFSNNSLGIIENNQLVRIWGTQSDITEKMRADQVQQVLFSISNAALSSISLPELIELISKEVGKLLDSTNFYIAFYDEKTDMLSTIYERDEKDVIETWPAKNSITGYVIKQQKSVLLREEEVSDFYVAAGIQSFGTPSKVWLGVPLEENKKTIGAIVVQSYDNPDAYTEKDKQMLEFISHQISISIERKRTEKDLKLMGKAFDQSPVTIVITDKEGHIEYVNPKFLETTGYTLDEVKGYNPRILQSGNQSREYYQELWETILDGKDWYGEFQNRRKNGEYYWESAVISPITDENGHIAYFLAIKEDITEKKKMIDDLIHARNKAEESDRLKSSFLANMSHEIRTPLNSIIGFSELLLDEDFGTEQHEEFARTINSSGNSLLTIISDIMDFSKIEAGQIQVKKKKFSVNKLINELQKEYSYKALEKGIELRLDPANPLDEIYIVSDEQRIRQVLINFVSNAIKFTEKGFVEIGFGSTSSPTGLGSEPGSTEQGRSVELQFKVKDSGIGISEEYHQQIFERFRQVETAHTRKYGGNGLGLAISKNLVELLGGQIGMESEKGKGSMFYFSIPNG